MTTDGHQILVGRLCVDVVRKRIKNLHIGVYPPNGRVRVAAPLLIGDDVIRLAIVARLGWIKRQQDKFRRQARQSIRNYVSGETHFFLGQRYRMRVSSCTDRSVGVAKGSKTLDLFVREESDRCARERVLLTWYRQQLRLFAAPLVELWADRMQLPTPTWGIKRMKTKWGTCNIEARRIWLNLELVKKPPQCLEYVIVHELAHFSERRHNDRFISLLDQYLPQWRSARDELNAAPLANEEWKVPQA